MAAGGSGTVFRLDVGLGPFVETGDLRLPELFLPTILQLESRSPSVTAALEGKEGSAIEGSLFGRGLSLVSFGPLNLEGLHWVIESQISLREALKPVAEME